MKSLPPQGFRNQSILRPPASYICVLRDVSYGDRYQIVSLENPKDIAPHLNQTFDVEIALVFQASDAGQSMRELLDFVGAARAGEWFDLDHDRFKSLRSLGTAGREHRRFSRPSNTLADLLANSESRAARQPATPRRRTEAAAAPRSRRSSNPVRAPGRQQRSDPAPAPAQPRPRNRLGKFIGLLFALLLLSLFYQPLTKRDLFADMRSLIEPVQPTAVVTQRTQVPSGVPLSKPIAQVASKSQTSVNIGWREASGVDNYQYRYKVNDGGFSAWQRTTRQNLSLSDLEAGDRVMFELQALRGGERSPVKRLTVNTLAAPTATKGTLSSPNARVADRSVTAIRFEWNAARGAEDYRYRYKLNDGRFSAWRITTKRNFSLSDLEAGDRVTFELRAQSADARSLVTMLTARTLAAPTATSTPTLEPTVTFTLSPEPSATSTASPEPSATHPPSETPTREPEPSATATLQTMFVETRNNLGANARTCPQTNCDILVTLRPDAEIQALGRVEGEEVYDSTLWIQFEYNGELAYIHSELVEVSSSSQPSSSSASLERFSSPSRRYSRSTVNVRVGPGTHFPLLGSVLAGTELEITGKSGDWYLIRRGSREAYIAGWLTYDTPDTPLPVPRESQDSATQKTVVNSPIGQEAVAIQVIDGDTAQTNQPQASEAAVDNCCFIGWQCNSDDDWDQGYSAFQENRCERSSQPARSSSPQQAQRNNEIYGSCQASHVNNCTHARSLGCSRIPRGHPAYRSALDRDDDGIACE